MDTATFDLELGRSILAKLKTREISLQSAAEHTGIPFTTLRRHLVNGGLTAREIHALASLLDTSVAALAETAAA